MEVMMAREAWLTQARTLPLRGVKPPHFLRRCVRQILLFWQKHFCSRLHWKVFLE